MKRLVVILIIVGMMVGQTLTDTTWAGEGTLTVIADDVIMAGDSLCLETDIDDWVEPEECPEPEVREDAVMTVTWFLFWTAIIMMANTMQRTWND